MNGKLILSIVAAIVLIHVGIVWYLFVDGRPSKPKTPAASAASSQADKPGAPAATAAPGSPATAGAQTAARAQAPQPVSLRTNPNFGKPFIYANAVKGDIGSIPLSANVNAGILVDLGTRQVLWAKDAKDPLPIASMTKMMTSMIAYEDVLSARNGLTLNTQIPVTKAACKIGGSQVYLDPRESFTLSELLQAVSIKSANDAAYLIAEHIGGGDVYSFVQRMNARAKALGMNSTRFHNPHGLPESSSRADNVSSAEDMAILAEHILEYKPLMEWAATKRADFRPVGSKGHLDLSNHNHLLESCAGVDGLKTGFINRSGFCITITCKRGDRRMVAVLMGVPNRKDRDKFASQLLDWGYRRAENPSAVDEAPAKSVAKKKAAAATGVKAPTSKKTSSKKPAKKAPASEEERSREAIRR